MSGVFTDLSDLSQQIDDNNDGDDDGGGGGYDDQLTQVESMCPNCHENGITRMLMTTIPFFRQVVVISFECKHCSHRNNSLQPAQQIEAKGVAYTVHCRTPDDLMRRVVTTESTLIEIPEIEFEVKRQSAQISTIEGIIDRALQGLKDMMVNSDIDSDSSQKLSKFLVKMNDLKEGNESFTFKLSDISGNSYVESLCAPQTDERIECNHFIRSLEDDKILGIYQNEDDDEGKELDLNQEVLQLATNCPNCNAPAFTNMQEIQIPHFKKVIIMATNCDSCGYKTNEVKSSAGIEDKGMTITLKINDENDLRKDVVISDTCSLRIPELDIYISSTGSGRYTTVEGIGHFIVDDLRRCQPFIEGDSSKEEVKEKMDRLFAKFSNLIGNSIILDDPCGNSYIEGASNVIRYERTFEQNEDLGLNDMKVENYQ